MASIDPAPFLQSIKVTTPAPNSPMSTILTSAISSSLTHLGYDSHLIQRVSLLSSSNTHTIECSGLQALLYHPSRTYGAQHALAKLFDDIKAKGASINSNEPVLLINSLGGLDGSNLHEIVDAASNILRYSYNIRPIRIYAGVFSPIGSAGEKTGFSMSLLNVVNTDIGGPSMVQLLEMANWEGKGAIRREHWDGSGWNLLERQDYQVAEPGYEDVKQEDISEAGGSEAGEWESEPEAEDDHAGNDEEDFLERKAASELVPEIPENQESLEEAGPDTTAAPDEAEVISDSPNEDPLSQRPQLRDIKHPSWEREHDKESLLDMIAKQSQRLPVSKAGNAYATAASTEKANLPGEDEYEIV